MLKGTEVALPKMLSCREARAALQKQYLDQYQQPLISFCLNVPGPVKTNPELQKAFTVGLQAINQALESSGYTSCATSEQHSVTGDEALLAVQADALVLKQLMTTIEEEHPLGRLFDIDVLTRGGLKLSRPLPRRCLICGETAQVCARSRRHSVAELTAKIAELLTTYFR